MRERILSVFTAVLALSLFCNYVLIAGVSANNTEPISRANDHSRPVNSYPAAEGNFCDERYIGESMTYMQNIETDLDDLLIQVNRRFGISFVTAPNLGRLPINIKSQNVPWTSILRAQFYVLGIKAKCIDDRTIQLVKNDDLTELESDEQQALSLETRYIKLKYLQPTSSGNQNIAGQSSYQGMSQYSPCQQTTGQYGGGGQNDLLQSCKFERLIREIQQILGATGNSASPDQAATYTTKDSDGKTVRVQRRPYVGQVPGRNMLLVKANKAQLAEIEELIKRSDIPPFQIVIKALVYTANENKLRDIGVQASAILGSANLKQLGGITSQPPVTSTGTGTGTGTATSTSPGQLNPGGVRTLGPGFLQPLGTSDSIFGLSAIVGTAQFTVQVTALEQNGIISLKSRPFATVLDGDTADLTVGRQIPVIIQATNNIGGSPGTLQILQAANLLRVTPHVIDDENGVPTAVNLELRLESNDVDTSVVSQSVPSVAVRSIQSKFILNQEQTAILGGFTVDSDTKTVSKTPGLGDIPILGELFKRRIRSTQINRLYFAISVTVIPYGGTIEPVKVPGATTDVPTITPEMLKRAELGEPKAVPTPTPTPMPTPNKEN